MVFFFVDVCGNEMEAHQIGDRLICRLVGDRGHGYLATIIGGHYCVDHWF